VKRTGAPRIIFITGTDTGVGKTLLTGLLLHHLRQRGCRALAMKPFSSGSRADAKLMRAIQGMELSLDDINPFVFAEPLAPLVAARKHRCSIRMTAVLRRIRRVASGCECLLIEGIGGVLVPLGEGFTVLDLVVKLGCETIVVSRNRLGTINHTMLTIRALQAAGICRVKTVLMASPQADCSSSSNYTLLSELLSPLSVLRVPFLGRSPTHLEALKGAEKKVKKTLAQILA
jgi:dethiobiotin synthetase